MQKPGPIFLVLRVLFDVGAIHPINRMVAAQNTHVVIQDCHYLVSPCLSLVGNASFLLDEIGAG